MFRNIMIMVLGSLALFDNSFGSEKKLVTINQFVPHPALSAALDGIKSGLEEVIVSEKAELKVANANGNITIAAQIAQNQAALSPHFMLAIATPSAQANLKARRSEQTLLGFVAVTDPEAAGLSKAPNLIGVTDAPPIAELITLALELFPQLKRVGVIYNPGEINSVTTIKELEKILSSENITLIKSPLNSSKEAKAAVQKLIGQVDLIYLPQDNTVISAVEAVVQEALKGKLPVVSNDPVLADSAVLLSLGCDYFSAGKQLGLMVAEMIKGGKVEPKIQAANLKKLRINQESAKKLEITIPEKILLSVDNKK